MILFAQANTTTIVTNRKSKRGKQKKEEEKKFNIDFILYKNYNDELCSMLDAKNRLNFNIYKAK